MIVGRAAASLVTLTSFHAQIIATRLAVLPVRSLLSLSLRPLDQIWPVYGDSAVPGFGLGRRPKPLRRQVVNLKPVTGDRSESFVTWKLPRADSIWLTAAAAARQVCSSHD